MKTWLDLTEACPIKFDVERMRAEIAQFEAPESWVTHYDTGLSQDWRAILLRSKHGQASGPESQRPSWDLSDFKRTPLVDRMPYFRHLMDEMKCRQGRVRILRLAPGASIGAHRDVGAEVGCLAFGQVRLHVPIVTNSSVTFSVGGTNIKMLPGRLYYANFSKVHFVRNDGHVARVHLVMDLEVNDWLTRIFPNPSPYERFEDATARALWPAFWKLRRLRTASLMTFWKHYEGSRAQRLSRAMRGKHTIS